MPLEGFNRTGDAVRFARDNGLLRAVAPRLAGVCDWCAGSVGVDDAGHPYSTCWNCQRYDWIDGFWPRPVLDKVVPVTYSFDDGLEALLHSYKRGDPSSAQTRSRGALVASVLLDFLTAHRACIESISGPISVAATIPPRVQRSFRPMQHAISMIVDPALWGVRWDHHLVQRVKPDKHKRGEMASFFYSLGPDRSVSGETVLLVDDTWTSGASMASVALLLREQGAAHVIGLPVGRQIGTGDYGTTQKTRSEAMARDWDRAVCVVCG